MTAPTTDPFSDPSSGVKITEYDGRLLLVTPLVYTESVNTQYGDTDCIDAEVVVLDGPGAPEDLGSVRIFQNALIGSLKPKIGRDKAMTLGRLGQGVAKNGNNPPWILNAANDADKKVARDYLARNPNDPWS